MIEMMTEQETFDRVTGRLTAQGGPSLLGPADAEYCAYRGAGGRRCAAGVMIPDSMYEPAMEGQPFSALYDGESGRSLADKLGLNVDLMVDLQQAHDQSVNDWEVSWSTRMRDVARKWNLNATALDAS